MAVELLGYYVIVTGVGQCAVDAINAATPSPALARVCLHVPGQIAWDDCQCGSFTQTAGPWGWSETGRNESPWIGDDNICSPPGYLGLTVTAEVLRCVTGPSETSLSPSCEALAEDSRQWHRDAMAMRRGIACCLEEMRASQQLSTYQILSHAPAGPQGGCVGSTLTYRIWLPNCDC